MSAGFTPGPWLVKRINYEKYGSDASFEVKAGRRTVAQTYMREIEQDGKLLAEDEANVNLIAAAPDLYEALQGAIDILGRAESNASGNPEWDYVGPRVNAARAALAKARGEPA